MSQCRPVNKIFQTKSCRHQDMHENCMESWCFFPTTIPLFFHTLFLFSLFFFLYIYILRKFNDSDPIILSVLNIHIYYLVQYCCHSDFIRVPSFQVQGFHSCFSLGICKIFVGLVILATKLQQYSGYLVQTWLTQLHLMNSNSIFVVRIMV